MAVIAPLKLHQHVAPRVASGKADSAHDSLCTRGHKADFVHVRKALLDSLSKFNFAKVRGPEGSPLEHFFVNGTDDIGVGVAVD